MTEGDDRLPEREAVLAVTSLIVREGGGVSVRLVGGCCSFRSPRVLRVDFRPDCEEDEEDVEVVGAASKDEAGEGEGWRCFPAIT